MWRQSIVEKINLLKSDLTQVTAVILFLTLDNCLNIFGGHIMTVENNIIIYPDLIPTWNKINFRTITVDKPSTEKTSDLRT